MSRAFEIKGIYPKLMIMMLSGAAIPLTSTYIKTGRYEALVIAIMCYIGFIQKYPRLMFKTDRNYRVSVLLISVLSAISCIVIPDYTVVLLALPAMFYVSIVGLENYVKTYGS